MKIVAKTFYFHKKRHFAAPLKENRTFFMKKIRGLVDSKFVKICHEQVISVFSTGFNKYLKQKKHTHAF